MEHQFSEKEKELIKSITEVLINFGVRSANMDDIAKHLKMSKKTLYKYFKDKSDIVQKVTYLHCSEETCKIKEILHESVNAIDEMIKISEFVQQMVKSINPAAVFDLKKYYPESFKNFEEHKSTAIKKAILENLKRGVEEGLYRDNINPEIVAMIYIQKVDAVWNPEVIETNKFSIAEVHLEMIRYHVRGVASQKGIDYLLTRINKEQFKL
jgi:AcrR family transcriptional regulator